MSRYLVGDELGNVKVLHHCLEKTSESKSDIAVIHHQDGPASVQKLVAENFDGKAVFSAAFSNGSCLLSSLEEDDSHKILTEWKEPRIGTNRFVGMSINQSSVYTCTSNGMLRRTPFTLPKDETLPEASKMQTAILPSRLYDWRLSADGNSFAYGGDEVELSVWDIERTFHPQNTSTVNAQDNPGSSKKRKRNDDLFPAELWRARNVPNDSLNLRQPVRITTLTYLPSTSSGHHLMTGTQFGDLRRYDTKAARRPVSNWTGIAKVGGVKLIEKGLAEHELFMSDGGFNLSAIDLRTGGILYSYKGIAGAVTSITQSPTLLVSTASDRFARFHSTVSPPSDARAHQEFKGRVIDKCYLTSTPTTVVWDKQMHRESIVQETEDDDDDLWDRMEHVN